MLAPYPSGRRAVGGSFGAAPMASIVTAHVAPDGIPQESGYTRGLLMLAGGLLIAALASLLVPGATTEDQAGSPPAA